MIADASQERTATRWPMVLTGVVLALTVVAANVLADTVRVGGGNGERELENDAPAARRGCRRRPVLPAAAGVPSGLAAVPPDRDPEALLEVRDLTVSAAVLAPVLVTGVSFATGGRVRCSAWSASPAAARR